jgi:hypothetical protein
MYSATYYRENALKARRLLAGITPGKSSEILEKLAQEYDDMAEELERGSDDNEPCRKTRRHNHAE